MTATTTTAVLPEIGSVPAGDGLCGRPATFATAHEKPWKDAVRASVVSAGVRPENARFAVRILSGWPPALLRTRSGISTT